MLARRGAIQPPMVPSRDQPPPSPTATTVSYFGANPDDSCWKWEQPQRGQVLDAAHGPSCS